MSRVSLNRSSSSLSSGSSSETMLDGFLEFTASMRNRSDSGYYSPPASPGPVHEDAGVNDHWLEEKIQARSLELALMVLSCWDSNSEMDRKSLLKQVPSISITETSSSQKSSEARELRISSSSSPSSPPPAPGNKANWKKQMKFKPKWHYCTFCKNNGEPEEWYMSHVLETPNGVKVCPNMREHVCEECGATGDSAHTIRYCPVRQARISGTN